MSKDNFIDNDDNLVNESMPVIPNANKGVYDKNRGRRYEVRDMNFLKGLVLFQVILLIVFIPGVYAITVSISSGDNEGSSGFSTTFKNSINNQVNLKAQVSPVLASIPVAASGTGPTLFNYFKQNSEGDYANVYAFIDGEGATWSYRFTPNFETATLVKYTETLTASNADHIRCYATAKNAEGDYAKVQTMLFSEPGKPVSITSYSCYAEAAKTYAVASQSMSAAQSGSNIQIDNWASNRERDSANSNLQAHDARIIGYSGKATAKLVSAEVEVTNLKATVTVATGNLIQQLGAQNTWTEGTKTYDSQASTGVSIPRDAMGGTFGSGSILAYPYSLTYPSRATATKSVVSVSQSVSGSGNWGVSANVRNSKYGYGMGMNMGFGISEQAWTRASTSKTAAPSVSCGIL